MIGIYRNGMETTAQRAQLVKLSGERCARGGSDGACGSRSASAPSDCSYRTPVLGRDLEIAATERLLSGTPKALQQQGLPGAGACAPAAAPSYQLLAFPLQRKVQLLKVPRRRQPSTCAIAKDVKDDRGRQQSQRAAAARLQRHQRPRKGPVPHSSPTSAASWSPKSPTKPPATSAAAPRASRSAPAKNAKGVVGQRRRRRRPRPESRSRAPDVPTPLQRLTA